MQDVILLGLLGLLGMCILSLMIKQFNDIQDDSIEKDEDNNFGWIKFDEHNIMNRIDYENKNYSVPVLCTDGHKFWVDSYDLKHKRWCLGNKNVTHWKYVMMPKKD